MTRIGFSSKFLWSLILGSTLAGAIACGSEPSTDVAASGGSTATGGAAGAGGVDAGGAAGSGGQAGSAGLGGGGTVIQDPDVAYTLDVDPSTKLAVAIGDVTETIDALGVKTVTAEISVEGLTKIANYTLTAQYFPGEDLEQPEPKWAFKLERTDGVPTSHEASFDGTQVKSVYRLGDIERNAGNKTDKANMNILLGMYAEGAWEESPALDNPTDRRWKRHPLAELGLGVMEHLAAAELTTISPKALRLAFDVFGGKIRMLNPEWAYEPTKDWQRELFGLDENDDSILISDNQPPNIVQCPFTTAQATTSYAKVGNSGDVEGTMTVNAMSVDAMRRDNTGGLQVKSNHAASISMALAGQANCPGYTFPTEVQGSVVADDEIVCEGTVCCTNGVKDSSEEVKLEVTYKGDKKIDIGGGLKEGDATHASTRASGSFSVCHAFLQGASATHSVQIVATLGA